MEKGVGTYLGENHCGGYGGGVSFTNVRAYVLFIPNANVAGSAGRLISPKLLGNLGSVLLLPLPNLLNEILPTDLVPGDTLVLHELR